MNTEQERAAFEAWRRKHYDYTDLSAFEIEFAFDAFQAGRAGRDGSGGGGGETMRFALSEMVKWYEKISLGYNPAFQYYDLAKKALLSAALQSQDREDAERYRFLRKQQPSSIHDSEQSIHAIKEAWARDFDPEARINVWSSAWLSGAELDVAIDHAMKLGVNK